MDSRPWSAPDETPAQYRARRNLAAKEWRKANKARALAFRDTHRTWGTKQPRTPRPSTRDARVALLTENRPPVTLPQLKWLERQGDHYSIA